MSRLQAAELQQRVAGAAYNKRFMAMQRERQVRDYREMCEAQEAKRREREEIRRVRLLDSAKRHFPRFASLLGG